MDCDYVGAYEPGELVLLRSTFLMLENVWTRNITSKSIVIQWTPKVFIPKFQNWKLFYSFEKQAARATSLDKVPNQAHCCHRFKNYSSPRADYISSIALLTTF